MPLEFSEKQSESRELQIVQYSRYILYGSIVLLMAVLVLLVWDVRLTRYSKKKTRQLSSSEERLRAIFQNSPDAIFIENEEGIVLDANPVACAFHGLTHEELVGKHIEDLVPEDQRESAKRDFPKWFTGELKRYECISSAAGGREVPVEVIGAPLQYEDQRAVVLQVRDMTERKRAEQSLKESESRYRELIEVQSSLITRLDTEGRFTFVNEAFCRFVGRDRGELIGEFFHPYTYYDDLDQPRQVMKALISGEERMVVTEHRMRAQTHIAWVQWEATAIYDESGCVVEIQAVGHDITERRRINEALEESERRLRFLFEEIPHIAVHGYNEVHEVLFWNRASEVLYGFSRDEATGKKIEDLVIPPDQRVQVAEAIDQWVQTGQPMPAGEMMKRRSDGHLVPVYSSRLATRNVRGEREMYVIDVDLSELKRASEELVKAKNFAERASRAKSEFLANMSHEIRTPMNGVMGMTHLLLDTGLDDEQHDLAETIMESTQELLTIFDELLDISRIESGEVRLKMEPFCPRETVTKVTLLFADRAKKKGVHLAVDVDPDVPQKMMGDAGRVRQVLINLVGNALKFTHEGEIQIGLRAEKIEKGWNLMADVKDTGVGMTPDLQQRVFDKFTQGDTSSTREFGGAGLGLAITKQLVEIMGGEISVMSAVGEGTRFNFNIVLPPLEEDVVSATVKPIDKKLVELAAEILLVEDNLVNQKVATALIQKMGCRVTVANNGAEALEVLPGQKFDLVFMDCQMPVMDGFEATRAIRQMVGELRDIPIVAITAHALKEDRQRCLDVGMDDYLSKPVHRDKLLAILQKYCG
ncbi:MAG: PAS domain S-box protein [Kiritimatiellales bacterium]|nr:PAS domain S-box protein [Kiritimatiellota bacterium]MBL7012452.1 PAS domain S-box protein [Kiritimatiellales bacterium]